MIKLIAVNVITHPESRYKIIIYESEKSEHVIFDIMLANAKEFLTQPYPDEDHLMALLRDGILSGLLIFFILYVFKPFDIASADHQLETTLIFGTITAVTSILYDLVMTRIVGINRDHPRWTFWKWILYIVVLMIFIAIANYIYMTIWIMDQPFYWMGLMYMLRGVLLIGIFPITIFGAIKMIQLLKKNQNIAANIQPKVSTSKTPSSIDLPIKNSTATWTIDPDKILYIEAQQNYVTITYVNESQGVATEMLRNTLSNIADALSDTSIIRCHRSYLVNQSSIKQISGNAQGLKLTLHNMDKATVPVSRKYISLFR